jgi:hypothetical protein
MKYIYKRSHNLLGGLLCTGLGIIFLALDHDALVLLAKEHGLIINGFVTIALGAINLIIWGMKPSEK